MEKICSKCHLSLPLLNFWKNKSQKDGYNNYCKFCLDKYRTSDLPKRNLQRRLRVRELRRSIIIKYGGKCKCCGEAELKFLAFDHINGGGRKHKELVGQNEKFLRWIVNNKYPSLLQILCHNCNQAKGAWGICPHQYAKMETERK